MNYSEYTYTTQPAHYGEGYSAAEIERISSELEKALCEKFPGLNFAVSYMDGASTPTRGPDDSVIEEIERTGSRVFDEIISKIG